MTTINLQGAGGQSPTTDLSLASTMQRLVTLFEGLVDELPRPAGGTGGVPPSGSPQGSSGHENAAPPQSPPSAQSPTQSAGTGPNTQTVTNTSGHDEKIGEFLNGGSTTNPVAKIDLKPGQSGTLNYQNGQGGYMAEANSSGAFQPDASRLEFYADPSGKNSVNLSYIDGRNAAVSVSDGAGHTAGDTKSIAASAPSDTMTKDAAGNPTIAGWYDGSTKAMQDGGAYMQSQLGTGGAYIHPNDDQNKAAGANPMTMAEDSSQHFKASFGNA